MYTTEISYLLGKWHMQELIREAEQARLAKLANQDRQRKSDIGSKALFWIRTRQSEKRKSAPRTNEPQYISNPCCSVTKS